MLHSICQQIWKTQQWPQDWKRLIFIPIPKKGNAKECSNYCTTAFIPHVSKVMLKILQARLQQYMNCELLDVQAGFQKGRETRDKIANNHWNIEKAREFQKNIYFCFIDYTKAFECVDHNKPENSERGGNTSPPYLIPEKSICRSRSNRTGHGTTYSFPYLEPVCCSMSSSIASWPTYRFLRRQVRWFGIPISLRIFQFVVIHTLKGFGVVNKAEVDVFLEPSCFFDDSSDVGNLSSGSSDFYKSSLNIWKFLSSCTVEAWLGEFCVFVY